MNLMTIASRVRRGEGLHYVLGRFRAVRVLYGHWRGLVERFHSIRQGDRKATERRLRKTLFPDADVDRVVHGIREDGIFVGLKLPADVVLQIKAFASSEPLHAIYDPNGPTFRYSDIVNGKAADGRPMPIGGVREPGRCPAVRAVMEDPVLREIVRRYLRHEPRTIVAILDWSFVSLMSNDERRALKYHVIDYHYDVAGFNSVYAFFYLTDTDRYSGAHVMMKHSHNTKPWRMLLGTARASTKSVHRQFGAEHELTVEGVAGTGFVEDASCYHRASPPTSGDRLMLALRFIN